MTELEKMKAGQLYDYSDPLRRAREKPRRRKEHPRRLRLQPARGRQLFRQLRLRLSRLRAHHLRRQHLHRAAVRLLRRQPSAGRGAAQQRRGVRQAHHGGQQRLVRRRRQGDARGDDRLQRRHAAGERAARAGAAHLFARIRRARRRAGRRAKSYGKIFSRFPKKKQNRNAKQLDGIFAKAYNETGNIGKRVQNPPALPRFAGQPSKNQALYG